MDPNDVRSVSVILAVHALARIGLSSLDMDVRPIGFMAVVLGTIGGLLVCLSCLKYSFPQKSRFVLKRRRHGRWFAGAFVSVAYVAIMMQQVMVEWEALWV